MPTLPPWPAYTPLPLPEPPAAALLPLRHRFEVPPEVTARIAELGLPHGLAWGRVHIDARRAIDVPRSRGPEKGATVTVETIILNPLQLVQPWRRWQRWQGYQVDLFGLLVATLPDPEPDWPYYLLEETGEYFPGQRQASEPYRDQVIIQVWSEEVRHLDSKLVAERRWHPLRQVDDRVRLPLDCHPAWSEWKMAARGLELIQQLPLTRGGRQSLEDDTGHPWRHIVQKDRDLRRAEPRLTRGQRALRHGIPEDTLKKYLARERRLAATGASQSPQ